jgi:hypothetical protein
VALKTATYTPEVIIICAAAVDIVFRFVSMDIDLITYVTTFLLGLKVVCSPQLVILGEQLYTLEPV